MTKLSTTRISRPLAEQTGLCLMISKPSSLSQNVKIGRPISIIGPGAEARSAACPLRKQRSRDRPLCTAHSVMEKNPSSTDSKRASCQLLVKE